MNSFEELGLSKEILEALQTLGFEKPTPIQAKTIPHLLTSNQDLIATAQTGTGKTAAFGLPAIQLTNLAEKHTQTLVLCPTRELCLQITNDLKKYAQNINGLSIVPIYGGANIEVQIKGLKRGAQIVVATPGRAIDLMKRKKLNLHQVERLILDEADEMLSMGFKEDIDTVLETIPDTRQVLLFSATMSKRIKSITKQYMDTPAELAAERVNMAAKNVQHAYYMVRARDRYEVVKRIADLNPNIYGIAFCRTRRETKEVANQLIADGYNADALHGDLSQAQRDEVMGRFRAKHLQVLVATDVASRGLDVQDLTHIINYNLPDENEIYIHRSGRTGRAGKHGISIAIISPSEKKKIRAIEHSAKITFTKKEVPTGKEICTKQLYALVDKIEKIAVDEEQISPFMPAIYKKLEWLSREDLIKHFVSAEFNRFLDYYKNAKDLNVSERDSRKQREKRRKAVDFTRLYINIGSKQKLNPSRLIALINEGLDSSKAVIGKIEILKKFSFFEIESEVAPILIDQLQEQRFEGVQLLLEISESKGAPSTDNNRRKKKGKSHLKNSGFYQKRTFSKKNQARKQRKPKRKLNVK